MKFNSQICTTVEQSKRLLELGMKFETADMCHHLSNPQDKKNPYTKLALDDYIYIHLGEEGWEDTIPAWSLHRLIELCPETIYFEEPYYDNEVYCSLHIEDKDRIVYHDYGSNFYNFDKHRNIYNNIIDCIDWLIKEGKFNTEYLK